MILDAWSRKVIGYAISHVLDTRICLAALEAALEERQPSPWLVHHSDRGVQYASRVYRQRLEEAGNRGSMTRRGSPYDNALVESFFKTLKHEEILAFDYETVEDVVNCLPLPVSTIQLFGHQPVGVDLSFLPGQSFSLRVECSETRSLTELADVYRPETGVTPR